LSNTGSNQYMMMLSEIYPFNLFEPQYSGRTIFSPHWHDKCLEMIYFCEGRAELHIGGEAYIAAPGDLFLIEEGVIHSCYLIDDMPRYYTILLDRYKIIASDLNSVEYGGQLVGSFSLPVLLQPEHPHYEEFVPFIADIIEEFTRKQLGFEAAVKAYLHILLTKFIRYYGASVNDNIRQTELYRNKIERLKNVISFLEDSYREKISIQDAAGIARMSPYHFCRVFKDAVGRTFNQYIQLYRIGKAEELLLKTDLPITLIAEQTGFVTAQNLGILFKRHRNCTPMQYRKNGGEGNKKS